MKYQYIDINIQVPYTINNKGVESSVYHTAKKKWAKYRQTAGFKSKNDFSFTGEELQILDDLFQFPGEEVGEAENINKT